MPAGPGGGSPAELRCEPMPMPMPKRLLVLAILLAAALPAAAQAAETAPDRPAGAGEVRRAEPAPGLQGMFIYMADAARFTECRTGRSYPVAMEGAYIELERAYLDARTEPGQPLLATIEGQIVPRPPMEGPGPVPTLVVDRFIGIWPGETCERNRDDAALAGTHWRIVRLGGRLGGAEIAPVDDHREPHLLLRDEAPPRFSATVGCNQMIGGYQVEGMTLRFSQVASTMMACPPPLDDHEGRLGETLAATRSWRIIGQVLELMDAEGDPVALLRAVPLP